MRRLLALAPLLAALARCERPASDPPSSPKTTTPPPGPRPAMSIPPTSDARTIEGKLVYEELPPVKSVKAYEGIEFKLITDSGEALPVSPGAAVSRDKLVALAGKRVSLKVRRFVPPPPAPYEQAPLGPDGKPLARPARDEVLAVEMR